MPATLFPSAPSLSPFTRIRCEVSPIVSLGPAPLGERRFVPLKGGTVDGPGLRGSIVEGGVDWQIQRADDVLEISAHYVIRAHDGALIEVRSDGLRHGPADVMQRLARGEAVPREAYFFRTLVRFTTGAAAWCELNRLMCIAVGQREADCVLLDLYRLG